ncbi:MAG TPA: hypothetical protein V6D33_15725, partial [Cyanophyceae cyanobacterium]
SPVTETGKYMKKLYAFFKDFFVSKCLIEDRETATKITKNSYRRVLKFIGDYVPYSSTFEGWDAIKENHVVNASPVLLLLTNLTNLRRSQPDTQWDA